MKLFYKLLLDFFMLVLFVFSMQYSLTGGFLHEVSGISLLLLFLVHIIINRRFYFSALKSKQRRVRLGFLIDVILLISSITLTVSSLAISRELLDSVGQLFSNYYLWRNIHILSAILIMLCMFAHIFMHEKLFKGKIRIKVFDTYFQIKSYKYIY